AAVAAVSRLHCTAYHAHSCVNREDPDAAAPSVAAATAESTASTTTSCACSPTTLLLVWPAGGRRRGDGVGRVEPKTGEDAIAAPRCARGRGTSHSAGCAGLCDGRRETVGAERSGLASASRTTDNAGASTGCVHAVDTDLAHEPGGARLAFPCVACGHGN